MKIKLFCMALCLCVFTACEKDEPVIPDEPVVPPTEQQPEQPEEPETPGEPEEPDIPAEPQEPVPTDGIVNWNNEFIIVGDNNMANIGNYEWRSIAFGNGRYVTVGGTTYTGYYTTSSNGTDWDTPEKLPDDVLIFNEGHCIAFGNGKFVISSRGGVYVSSDGMNWTSVCVETSISKTSTWGKICFSNGNFYLLGGQSGASFMGISNDGSNWNVISTIESFNMGIAYGNGKYVMVRNGNVTSRPSWSDISSDGVNWSKGGTINDTMLVKDVAFGNGKFVAVGKPSAKVFYSTDGVNWSIGQNVPQYYFNSVIFNGEKFISAGTSGHVIQSTDGVNWTDTKLSTSTDLNDICPVQ